MKTCKKCGSTEFNNSGCCKPCISVYQAEYREKNAEKAIEYNKKYRYEKAKEINAQRKNYRLTHKEEKKIADAKYYSENLDRVTEYKAAYYKKNRSRLDLLNSQWIKNNPEKFKKIQNRYSDANPENKRIHCQNRRARIRKNGGQLSRGIAIRLFKSQKGKCACCHKRLTKYHLDHIMPLSRGGRNEDSNIQLLCQPCNQKKFNKHPIDFMQSLGFLL